MPQDIKTLKRVDVGVYRDNKGNLIDSKGNMIPKNKQLGGGSSTPKQGGTVGSNNPKAVSQQGLSDLGRNTAASNLNGTQLDQAFQNPIGAPNIGANFGTVSQIADQAFGALDRDITTREGKDKAQAIAELANRGVNINNPNDPTYRAFMDDFERKYSLERQNAQDQAYQQGLSATQGLGQLDATQQQGQYDRATGTRTQQLGEVKSLTDLSSSALAPGQTQFQLESQRLAARKSGGGGQAASTSPFKQTTVPGYRG